jgi:hypothetical protein
MLIRVCGNSHWYLQLELGHRRRREPARHRSDPPATPGSADARSWSTSWRQLPLVAGPPLHRHHGLLFATAALVGWLVWLRVARLGGLDVERLLDVGFYPCSGAIGSKAGLVLTDPGFLSSVAALVDPGRPFGVLAAVAVIVLYTRRHGLPFWRVTDRWPSSRSVRRSRMGYLMAGCCYGRQAPGLAWDPLPIAGGAAVGDSLYDPSIGARAQRAPSQAYQALVCALLLPPPPAAPRREGALQFIGLCAVAGTIEFLRGDAERGLYTVPDGSGGFHSQILPRQLLVGW